MASVINTAENISYEAIGYLLCKMAWPALGQTRLMKQI